MSGAPTKKAAKTNLAPEAAHPKYSKMIALAITALNERTGSSQKAIIKYIKANFKVGYNVYSQVKAALKREVAAGTLQQVKESGASGFKVKKKPKKIKKPKKKKANKAQKSIAKKAAKKLAKKHLPKKPTTKKPPKKATNKPEKKAKKRRADKKAKKAANKKFAAKKPAKPAPKKPAAKKSAKKTTKKRTG